MRSIIRIMGIDVNISSIQKRFAMNRLNYSTKKILFFSISKKLIDSSLSTS